MIKAVLLICCSLTAIVFLKQIRPEYAFLTRAGVVAVSAIAFITVTAHITETLYTLAGEGGIDEVYIKTALKILCAALVCECGGNICNDCGETALATQVELAGRIVIAGISLPIIEKLIELSVSLISG